MVAAALGGAALVGGVYSANKTSKAAQSASATQSDAALAGIDAQQANFAKVQELLSPFVTAGTGALTGQQNLLGLNGADAQGSAISALQQSPLYTSQLAAGENSIRQNASATGGLRGGNIQAALAQFSPQLLAQTIQQQYSNLGGLASLGQNAAAGVGNAGSNTANNVSSLLQQQGSALAGGALASGSAANGASSSINGALGIYAGLGGFGTTGGYSGYSGYTGNSDPLGNFIKLNKF